MLPAARGWAVTVISFSPSCFPFGDGDATLWASLFVAAATAAAVQGPGEYCRHGRPGAPENPHAPHTHKTTPTRRPEHLRDYD